MLYHRLHEKIMSRYHSHPSSLYRAFLFAIFLATISACSLQRKVNNFYKSPSGEELLIHRVSSVEENLRLIALWYTGSASKETEIRRSNPQLKSSLKVGDFIAIPRDVLLQTEPLTSAFIESQKAELVKPKTTSKTAAASRSRKAVPAKNSKASPAVKAPPQQKASEVKESAGNVQQASGTQQPIENTPSEPPPSQNAEPAPTAGTKTEKKESETLEDQLLKNLLTDN